MLKLFKYGFGVLLTLVYCLQFSTCNAAMQYDEEQYLPVGAYFKVDTEYDVHYAIKSGGAKVVLSKYGKEVYLYKTGKVLLQASYYIDGNPDMPNQRTYLLNVVPMNVFQSVQTNKVKNVNAEIDYEEVYDNFAQAILKLVNEERAKVNAKPLRLVGDLQRGASIRAKELPLKFAHERPNGKEPFTVISNLGRGVGENIAAGQSSAEEVMDSWMNSPGHRSNILNPRFSELGVGFYSAEGNDPQVYGLYWVQMFRG